MRPSRRSSGAAIPAARIEIVHGIDENSEALEDVSGERAADTASRVYRPRRSSDEWRSQQNGHTDLDQSLKLAHQPKKRNCDLNGISEAGSPAGSRQEINIYLVPVNRRGRYRAELVDGKVLCLSRQPFLDAARALIAAGLTPNSVLIGWRRGSAAWVLKATLGEAAKLTVDETKTCFARWKPFSSSAVCAPVRFSDGAATSLAAGVANSPSAPPGDPDQHDIRRRRTGGPS